MNIVLRFSQLNRPIRLLDSSWMFWWKFRAEHVFRSQMVYHSNPMIWSLSQAECFAKSNWEDRNSNDCRHARYTVATKLERKATMSATCQLLTPISCRTDEANLYDRMTCSVRIGSPFALENPSDSFLSQQHLAGWVCLCTHLGEEEEEARRWRRGLTEGQQSR